jgi:CheY-like chemotaxis protein
MKSNGNPVSLLMADDDDDDRMLARDALQQSQPASEIDFVEDGEELIDYLQRRGKYSTLAGKPLPDLILLDLNMPRKDGREALMEIKGDPALRKIPVVVLTTSNAEEDVHRSYDLGVNSFIVKPVSFESLVAVMRSLARYWFDIVELPYARGDNTQR